MDLFFLLFSYLEFTRKCNCVVRSYFSKLNALLLLSRLDGIISDLLERVNAFFQIHRVYQFIMPIDINSWIILNIFSKDFGNLTESYRLIEFLS